MKGNLLVVDNEAANRQLISKVLANNGYHVEEADGFQSAINKLTANDYDLLLTDKNMPLGDIEMEGGLELIRWVRQNKPDLAVLLLTGYPTVDSAIDALKLGAFDYLLKPLDLKLLLQKVDRVCEYRRTINPEAIISAYQNLNREIMQCALESASDKTGWLTQVQERLNHVFNGFRTVERTLLEHRQRLAEIEVLVEQVLEDLPEDDPMYETLTRVSQKASQRI
jgi:CheY-like chemotaxis protein